MLLRCLTVLLRLFPETVVPRACPLVVCITASSQAGGLVDSGGDRSSSGLGELGTKHPLIGSHVLCKECTAVLCYLVQYSSARCTELHSVAR